MNFLVVLTPPSIYHLTRMPKLRHFLMRGQQLSLCQRPRSRTSYHSNMGRVLYHRKLSHKSTVRFTTINPSCSQQISRPPNRPAFQRLHLVWKIMTRYCCSIFLCCKKLKHENQIIVNTKHQWYKSNCNINIYKISHLPLKMLCYFTQIKMIPCETKYNKPQFPILWSVPLLISFDLLGGVKRRHARNNYK